MISYNLPTFFSLSDDGKIIIFAKAIKRMSKIIQVGLASFGMSGRVFHGPSLNVNPNYKIKKILERTKRLSADLYPDSEIVCTYDELLNDTDIDLIVVNTPDIYHYAMAKAALMAGKHVVVEKPFAQTPEEALELIKLAKEKQRVLTVYQNRRWDGDFLTVKQVVEEGVLGRIVEFESHFDRYRNFIQDGTWKEEAGDTNGVLFNLGTHMIDQALVLFGVPNAVTAHLQILRTGGKVLDYYDIRLQYEGFAALLKCSYLVKEPGPRYTVHGTMGSFQKFGIDPQEQALNKGDLPLGENWGAEDESSWGTIHTETNGKDVKIKRQTLNGNYPEFYKQLYNTIILGSKVPVEPEEALLTLDVMYACIRSNKEKKTIPFKASM